MSAKKADPQLSEISKKLDILIRLSALDLVRGIKTQKERIGLLSDADFQPKQIADILGISRNNVNVFLHLIRKERAAKQTEEAPISEVTVEPASVANAKEEQKSAEKT